jgi:hypothetical protein
MRRQFSERRRQRVLAEGDPDAPATPGSGFWKTRSAGARYSNSNTNEEALNVSAVCEIAHLNWRKPYRLRAVHWLMPFRIDPTGHHPTYL